jgi:Bacterial Ig domain
LRDGGGLPDLLVRLGRIPSSSRPTLDRRNAPRRRPLFAAAATAASLSLLGVRIPLRHGMRPAAPSASVETNAARLGIRPADGVSDADPWKGISVSVARGTIANVTVRTPADPVQGRLAHDDRRWHSIWALNTHASYTVVETAVDRDGRTVTARSTFRTLHPGSHLRHPHPPGVSEDLRRGYARDPDVQPPDHSSGSHSQREGTCTSTAWGNVVRRARDAASRTSWPGTPRRSWRTCIEGSSCRPRG